MSAKVNDVEDRNLYGRRWACDLPRGLEQVEESMEGLRPLGCEPYEGLKGAIARAEHSQRDSA